MMNIRKFFKVRNYYLLLGVIMINVGCTKNFLEYNTNPNEATDEMTDWDNVRTGFTDGAERTGGSTTGT